MCQTVMFVINIAKSTRYLPEPYEFDVRFIDSFQVFERRHSGSDQTLQGILNQCAYKAGHLSGHQTVLKQMDSSNLKLKNGIERV
jgi:hypothetical protein